METYKLKEYDLLFFNVIAWDDQDRIYCNKACESLAEAMVEYNALCKKYRIVEIYETNMYCLERNERK